MESIHRRSSKGIVCRDRVISGLSSASISSRGLLSLRPYRHAYTMLPRNHYRGPWQVVNHRGVVSWAKVTLVAVRSFCVHVDALPACDHPREGYSLV